MNVNVFLRICFLLGGVWSILCFIPQYLRDRKRSFELVIGKVVYMEEGYIHKHGVTHTPVYQYEYNGAVYQKPYRDSARVSAKCLPGRSPAFAVGNLLTVMVDRNEPEYAVVKDYTRYMPIWKGLALILVGLILFG